MTHKKLKLAIAGVIFAGALAYLAVAGASKGWTYTLSVDSFLASAEHRGQRVRLCGIADETGMEVHKAQLFAKFLLKGEHGGTVPVSYHGAIPEMFKAGAEVLVEGKLNASGVFESDAMMTKCASKYEAMPKGHPTTGAQPSEGAAGGGS